MFALIAERDVGMTCDLLQFRKEGIARLKLDIRKAEVSAPQNVDGEAIPKLQQPTPAVRRYDQVIDLDAHRLILLQVGFRIVCP